MRDAADWLRIGLAAGLFVKLGGHAAVPTLMRTFGTLAGGFVAGFQSVVATFGMKGILYCAVAVAVAGLVHDMQRSTLTIAR